MTPTGRWVRFVQMLVYVARYAMQPCSELRTMPLSTFYAWHYSTNDMIKREGETGDE